MTNEAGCAHPCIRKQRSGGAEAARAKSADDYPAVEGWGHPRWRKLRKRRARPRLLVYLQERHGLRSKAVALVFRRSPGGDVASGFIESSSVEMEWT